MMESVLTATPLIWGFLPLSFVLRNGAGTFLDKSIRGV